MKRRFIYSVILLGLMSLILLGYQIPLEKVKIWQESTVADFVDGEFQNTVLEDKNGGLIRLPHPMQWVQQDSLISSCPRFVAYDSLGNFYATWVEQPGKNVFLEKYDPMGEKIGEQVQVNDTTSRYHSYLSAVAVMPTAGRLMVAWGDDRNFPGSSTQRFAQLFDLDLNKIGSNINISRDKIDRSNSDPAIFANSVDGTFWVFLRISGEPGKPKLFIQRCTVSGELVGVPFAVNPDHIFYNEWNPAAIPTPDGGCVVVWCAIPEQGMDYPNIYGIRLSVSGAPVIPPQKINDDSVPNGHYSPDIARDSLGNFLIAWSEWREYAGEFPIYQNIYGQYVDSLIKPVRENFLVSLATKELRSDSYPDVEWKDNCFVITWLSWDEQKRENDLFKNFWKFQPVFNGKYTSSIFDMGTSLGDPEFISWQSLTNWDTNSIKFQLRAAQELDSLLLSQWLGSTDSIPYYINASGDSINPILRNQRYIQYRALLATRSISVSPVLDEVSITYVAYDTIAPAIPRNLQAVAGHSQVNLSWDANREIDLMAYRIYRITILGEYSSKELATVFQPTTSFVDTSAVTGVNYYYVITAVDSNLNESTFSDEVMAVPFGIKIFVDDDVATNGDGSKANPFLLIRDGLHTAIFGDTVLVLPGNYTENIAMKTGVVLKGSGARVTTIKGFIDGANEAVLQGFTIISPGSTNARPAVSCQDCGPKILNNIIINYGSETTSGPAIFCAQSQYMFKESPPTQPYIAKNLIRSFRTSLFCMDSAHVVFTNNLIVNKGTGFQTGIDLTFSNSIIRNNSFFLNGSMGSTILISMSNPVISNNIIFNPNDFFEGLNNYYGLPQISYNNIRVGREAYHDCSPGIGAIQADPLFVNIDRADFRLADNSPCIDAGDPDSIYNDIDDSRNDMGAFGGPDPIDLSLTLKLFLSAHTSSASAFPGDTVKISVAVDNAAGIAAAEFTVEFNDKLLAPLKVNRTPLTEAFTIQADFSQSNEIKVKLTHDREIAAGQGNIVNLFFVVNPGAQSEQATPLTLRSAVFIDGSGSQIEIKELTHGVFVVNYLGTSENLIYVNDSNTGFEDGSRSHPYNTINEGIFHASDGDTVVVLGGIYHEKVEINKGVFLKGSGAQTTTVEAGSDAEFEDYTIHLNTRQSCGMSGFTVINKSYGFIPQVLLLDAPEAVITKNRIIANEMWPGLLIRWSSANGGVLLGNYLHGGGNCLEIKNSTDLLIQNNRFISKVVGAYALSCDHSQVIITGNRLEVGNAVVGIRIMNSSQGLIQNNVIESVAQQGRGIEIQRASANIANNTIVTSEGSVRSLTNSSISVMNNIIVGAKIDNGIYSQGEAVSSYNNVWNHRFNYNGLSAGIGDISANPLFADSVHSDFHLAPGSPCIDAGNPDPAYNDLDGSRNDMGAFGGPLADTTGFLGRQIAVALVAPQHRSGDTLCIPVTATSMQGISSIEIKVEYNESHLRLLAVKHGEITQPFSLSESQESPGIASLRLASPLVIRHNSGSICELIAQVQTTTDTATIIRLNDLIFKDQVDNVYAAAPVEGRITITEVKSANKGQNLVPDQFALLQNYPNPFNPSTVIRYNLPASSFISLKIYNLLGQEIYTLYEGMKLAGSHSITWKGKDYADHFVASGIYICTLSIDQKQEREFIKLVLIR